MIQFFLGSDKLSRRSRLYMQDRKINKLIDLINKQPPNYLKYDSFFVDTNLIPISDGRPLPESVTITFKPTK